ncbi:MAG: GNAT family N-acetyltransferase [bacterium]|nr:GNAT family N-acetyltransferase [bacterium]
MVKKVAHLLATEIYEEEGRRGSRHRWMSEYLSGHPWAQTFGAFDGNKLVGAIAWDVSDMSEERISLELCWIAVLEARRSEGIGARLVRETLPQFLQGDRVFKELELTTVWVISSAGSTGFYQKVLKPFRKLVVSDVWEYEVAEKDQTWFWARVKDVLGSAV